MTKKEYNGWFNYETWLVKLWMDNDQGTQEYFAELTREIYEDAEADDTFSRMENAALALSDRIKEYHEEAIESAGSPSSGFIADLVNAAMSEVNWHEIAESLLENVEETEEAE